MWDVETIFTLNNKVGEGPLWDSKEKVLYWVDIESHVFYRYNPENGNLETFKVGLPVGVLRLRENGGIVMATKKGFAFWNYENSTLQFISDPEEDKPGNRFNDGNVDRAGRFWAGTMFEGKDEERKDQGSLYRLDPDGTVKKMESGLAISNGIGWSLDNKTMYLTDTPRSVIYAYDFEPDSGKISNRRDFIKVPKEEGMPDGLTIDSEGFIWSACWGGSQIIRYTAEGKVDRKLKLPTKNITCCIFGGENLNELYITSATSGLSEEEKNSQSLAGALFRVKTPYKGQDSPRFKG